MISVVGAQRGWGASEEDLSQQLEILAGFATDFLGKLAGKVANGDHVIVRHPDCDHLIEGVWGWSEL